MIVHFRTFLNIFKIEDLRNKIAYTFGVLAFFRLGQFIPLPGINAKALISLAGSVTSGGFMSYLDIASGGALKKGSIFALGISPYIQASLMMQVLSISLPYLEALSKEGDIGRKIIGQYTRYLAVAISVVQSMAFVAFLEAGFFSGYTGNLFINPGMASRLIAILMLSVGSILVMWFGEQISRYGIGYGSSLLIFASIVSGLPASIIKVVNGLMRGEFDLLIPLIVIAFVLAITAIIIFVERGERRVPIQYARKIVGSKVFGGTNSYIPFKLNAYGIMAVILSGSIMSAIVMSSKLIAGFIPALSFLKDLMEFQSPFFLALQAFTIMFFSYVYTAIMYDPIELAEKIRKDGGFIPGIRPGRKTAECFNFILQRIGLPGAIYIASLAIIPDLAIKMLSFPVGVSGLSVLIAVGVALDTASQIESYLIERRYDGFLGSSRRIKGRRA